MLPALHRITRHINLVRFGSAAIDEIWEDARRYGLSTAPRPTDEPRLPLRDRIRFEAVSYAYRADRRPALSEVTLEIPRGTWMGIVGATGAGKTTFVDVLLGLLEPTGGRVLVDGVPIRERPRGWRAAVGYVPQAIYLVDDTLRRNVALGRPDADIDEARVEKVLEQARLTKLVSELPEGLDTVVGERGVRLSGGERQRVAIARALYGDPEVLVFDEATSSLDNLTEREITEALEGLRGERTVLAIAHRLSTVERSDAIVMLEEGRVVAVGTYASLLETEPRFRALAGGV